jgi:hypothetical protein
MRRRPAMRMNERVPSRGNPQRKQVSRSFPIPASTKGWIANQAITVMDPQGAVLLDNWWPLPEAQQWRRGSQSFCDTGETSAVETLAVWQGGSTVKRFAVVNGKLIDVTTGTKSVVTTGLASNRWQWVNFTPGSGNPYLVMCNGADPVRNYDGTSWTLPAITGPTSSSALIVPWIHKSRLWFIESGTADAWYLPVSSIAGAATRFPLGPFLKKGGALMAGCTWTHDAGAGGGPVDYCVFISDQGEVIVYSGTDPSSSSTWAMTGRFVIGRPIGRRCTLDVASDTVILCQDGVMPLSKAIAYERAAAAKASFTWNIQTAFQDAYSSYGLNFGWQILSFAPVNMAIINVPTTAGAVSQQYVMNVLTGAWARFKGQNAACWAVSGDQLFFGGVDGKVYQAWTGSADGSTSIQADWISAYNDLGMKGIQKSVKACRPVFITDPVVTPAVGVAVDYNDQLPTVTSAPSGAVSATIAKWDVAVWDVDVWPPDTNVDAQWRDAYGDGYQIAAAVSLNITSTTPTSNLDCKLTQMTVLFEPGSGSL